MNEQAQALQERSNFTRYVELDSLRGLAAFTVIWHHFFLAPPHDLRLVTVPLVAGRQAVMLFFVLSGFVLSIPFWRKGVNGPYVAYLIRRFFRIYVPFAFAAGLALAGAYRYSFSNLPLGAWFRLTWHTALTPHFVLSQFLLWPTSELNTAFWSLRYEVQMSIVFPLMLLLIRFAGTWRALLLALSVHYLAIRLSAHPGNWHDYKLTLYYGPFFVFGALLAKEQTLIRKAWESISWVAQVILVAAASGIYYYGAIVLDRSGRGYWGDLATAGGASGLLVAAIYFRPFQRLLLTWVAVYLGRISYSMYLVHGTILFVLLNMCYGKVSPWLMAVLFLILTIIISHVFCVLIEETSLRLGKRLATRTGPMQA